MITKSNPYLLSSKPDRDTRPEDSRTSPYKKEDYKKHASSPDKSKRETSLDGEISDDEPSRSQRDSVEKDKRQRVTSFSDHSNTETAVSVNGVKEVCQINVMLIVNLVDMLSRIVCCNKARSS